MFKGQATVAGSGYGLMCTRARRRLNDWVNAMFSKQCVWEYGSNFGMQQLFRKPSTAKSSVSFSDLPCLGVLGMSWRFWCLTLSFNCTQYTAVITLRSNSLTTNKYRKLAHSQLYVRTPKRRYSNEISTGKQTRTNLSSFTRTQGNYLKALAQHISVYFHPGKAKAVNLKNSST